MLRRPWLWENGRGVREAGILVARKPGDDNRVLLHRVVADGSFPVLFLCFTAGFDQGVDQPVGDIFCVVPAGATKRGCSSKGS